MDFTLEKSYFLTKKSISLAHSLFFISVAFYKIIEDKNGGFFSYFKIYPLLVFIRKGDTILAYSLEKQWDGPFEVFSFSYGDELLESILEEWVDKLNA